MKSFVFVGIFLIILGAVSLVYKSVEYTTKEKVVDIGPIEAIVTKHNSIPLTPIFGVVSLIAGLSLVFMGYKNKNI